MSVDLFLQRHPGLSQYTLAGCDISGFQGPDSIDPAFDFVIIKATEGQTYDEDAAPAQRDRAIADGIPYGYYHFARPDLHQPEEEAYHFSAVVQRLGGPGDVPPGLDCENPGKPAEPMPGDWTAWVLRWLQLVEVELGVRPEVYTGPAFAGEHFTSDPTLGSYGLWLAHYAGAGQPPWVPWPWTDARIWQWTSTSSTYGHLDLNVAKRELLVNTLGPASVPTEPAQEAASMADFTKDEHEQVIGGAVSSIKLWQAIGYPEPGKDGGGSLLSTLEALMKRAADGAGQRVLDAVQQYIEEAIISPSLAKIPTSALCAEVGRRLGFDVAVTPIAPPPPPAPPANPTPAPAAA